MAARSLASATEFAATHGVRAALESYSALVESESVDIVHIGTITPLHKEHVEMAIAAGKHVLCEKPLAESAADAEQLYGLAKEKGVMLQEGMWTRFFPAVELSRQCIEKGRIGTLKSVTANMGFDLNEVVSSCNSIGKHTCADIFFCLTSVCVCQ